MRYAYLFVFFLLFAGACHGSFMTNNDITIIRNTRFIIERIKRSERRVINLMKLHDDVIIPISLYNNIMDYHIHLPVKYSLDNECGDIDACIVTKNSSIVSIQLCYTRYDSVWLLSRVATTMSEPCLSKIHLF